MSERTVLRAAPGSVPRNGLPERRDYTYRGTGRDELTGHLATYRLHAETAAGAVSVPPRQPAPAAAVGNEVTRQDMLLRMCPSCWEDACQDCLRGPCKCACRDEQPRPAAGPQPAPRRCERCGYLTTAPGHKITCGGAS